MSYYAFVASPLIDGDLHFENEYRHANQALCHMIFDENGEVREDFRTQTGRLGNFYSVGPALFWAPFFSLAHVGVLLHNAFAEPENAIAADGYSPPYLTMSAIGSAFVGFIGLCFAYALARAVSGSSAALAATLGIWLASNLPVYMYLLPFMAHAHSAFINSVFVWYWWRTWREPTPAAPLPRSALQWVTLGVLAGLVFDAYHQGALLWVFILVDGLVLLWAWQRDGAPLSDRAVNTLRAGVPLFLGILLGALPTLASKWILYGTFFSNEYVALTWSWMAPNALRVLFSSEHGLWTWTPVLMLACFGLVPLVRRNPGLGWRCTLAFLACLYMIGAKTSWGAGSSFSNRYFLILVPIFVIGLAEFLRTAASWIEARRPGLAWPALSAAIAVLILWNAGFVFQWAANLIPNRGPISFREMARNQVTVVPVMLVGNAVPILFDRSQFVDTVENEDLAEVQKLELRRGVCGPERSS